MERITFLSRSLPHFFCGQAIYSFRPVTFKSADRHTLDQCPDKIDKELAGS